MPAAAVANAPVVAFSTVSVCAPSTSIRTETSVGLTWVVVAAPPLVGRKITLLMAPVAVSAELSRRASRVWIWATCSTCASASSAYVA